MKLFLTLLFSFVSCLAYSQNVVVHYKLNGDFTDYSSSNNHLSTFSTGTSPTFAQDFRGSGSDSSIEFHGGQGLRSSQISNSGWAGEAISFWIKGSNSGIVCQGAFIGFGVFAETGGRISAFFDASSSGKLYSTSNTDLYDGDWHHVVTQNNSDTTFIYIDGGLDTFQAETLYTSSSASARLYLGITNLQLAKLTGNIDQFRLYDDVLDLCKIQELYDEGNGAISYDRTLIAHYKGNGNLIDSSSNSNHLSLFSTGTDPTFSEGVSQRSHDSAFDFHAGRGYRSISVNNQNWNGTTVSCWYKGTTPGILIQGAFLGFGIQVESGGVASAFFDLSSSGRLVGTNNVDLFDGEWHNIIAMNNGDTTYLYIDGDYDSQKYDTLYTMPGTNSNARFYLGLTNLSNNKLDGELDDIRIYDNALSPCEIAMVFDEGNFDETSYVTIEDCDSIIFNGITYFNDVVVIDSFINKRGGDSIIITDLLVHSTDRFNITVEECDSASINGIWVYSSQTVVDSFINSHSCDSIVTFIVTISRSWVKDSSITECDSVALNGNWYYSSIQLHDSLLTSKNCDSIFNYDIVINPSYAITNSLSGCDSIQHLGLWYYNDALHTQNLISSLGCDSTVETSITVNPTYSIRDTIVGCDSVMFESTWYNTSQVIEYNGMSQASCDSNETHVLIVNPSYSNTIDLLDCDSVLYSGNWYTSDTVLIEGYVSQKGCDSSTTISIKVNESKTTDVSISGNDSLLFEGSWYYSSQSFTNSLFTTAGCDSIVNVQITVFKTIYRFDSLIGCDTVLYKGLVFTENAQLRDTFVISNDVDSIVVTDIYVSSTTYSSSQIEACDFTTINGVTYQNDTTIFIYEINTSGCDSIASIEIKINNSSTTYRQLVACEREFIDGKPYTESERITWVGTSKNGCDSTLVTDLTIIQPDDFVVYPNPASEYLRFNDFNLVKDKPVEIFDMLGQKVFEFYIPTNNELDVRFLAKGVYVIRVNRGLCGIVSQKWIKE